MAQICKDNVKQFVTANWLECPADPLENWCEQSSEFSPALSPERRERSADLDCDNNAKQRFAHKFKELSGLAEIAWYNNNDIRSKCTEWRYLTMNN